MQIGEHKLVDKGSHTIIHKGKTVIHKTFLQQWWVGVTLDESRGTGVFCGVTKGGEWGDRPVMI